MANESTKWLYDQLKGKGYNVGKDVAEFDSLMRSNADSRKWAYETATKSGLNVGKDIDEFSSLGCMYIITICRIRRQGESR